MNIYVDAVINHMCGAGGGEGQHSSCGTWFNAGKKDFPSVPYSHYDFNDGKCKTSSGNIESYSDVYQVRLKRCSMAFFDCVLIVSQKTKNQFSFSNTAAI